MLSGGAELLRQKNRLRTILCCLCMIFLTGTLFAGCGRRGAENYDYYIYYLNQDKTSVVPLGYEPEADPEDTEAMIEEFIEQIENGTDRVEYQKVYPESVSLERYAYTENQLYLYFNSAYSDMSAEQEILCRGAIAWSMLQIEGISGVSFFVNNQPLKDANGKEVGIMTSDSFLNNPGEEINDIQVADLTLYFASLDGQSLVSETQHVHYYSSNISMEKLVMEQLLEGPKSDNAQSAIPEGTKLINVSVMDGVCFVNLDENFLTQNYDISEDVVIYSIVNSLVELPTVNMVQLSVNGDTDLVYRQTRSFKEFYSMNRDLVREEGDDVDVEQQGQNKGSIIDTGNLLDTGK